MKIAGRISILAIFMLPIGSLAQNAPESLPNAPSSQLSPAPPPSAGSPGSSLQSEPRSEKKDPGGSPANASSDPSEQLRSSVHTPAARLTFDDKFTDYLHGTFGPRAVFLSAIVSGIKMANPPSHYPNDWRQGAEAYGRLYGDAFAQGASAHTGRFITGVLLHEDFRYRPSTSRNPGVRTLHALAYTFFDKSDSGHARIAFSNFVGAAAGGFVGNAYLPSGFANVSHASSRSAVEFGGYAGNNLLSEFGPDLMRLLTKLHLSQSQGKTRHARIYIPEWWVPKKDDH